MTYKIKKKKKAFGLFAIMFLSLINFVSADDLNLTMKLVNVDDVNTGLLPDIYHGTLRFFSVTLSPMIIFIFLLFIVLIILLIGAVIKKIAKAI